MVQNEGKIHKFAFKKNQNKIIKKNLLKYSKRTKDLQECEK